MSAGNTATILTETGSRHVNCASASVTARRPVFMCTHKYQMLKAETCGYEIWSLTFREERRTTVFENRVLRKIVRPKRDQEIGKWRRLQNKKLHVLYSSLSIIRVIKSRIMRYRGPAGCMGGRSDAYRGWAGRSGGKSHLEDIGVDGRIILKWPLQNVGWGGMDWSHLAQNRERWRAFSNVVMDRGSIKAGEFLD